MKEQVFLYCERTSPDFWAEPFNAWSNLAFFISATAVADLWRKRTPDDLVALFFILLVVMQGVGSFLFHTYATRWAGLADVLPIAIFILTYLMIGLRRYLELGWLACAAALFLFIGVVPMTSRLLAPMMGNAAIYMPELVTIFVVGSVYFKRNRELAVLIFAAGCTFATSLTFRILDPLMCEAVPSGTHFLWHIFNGITVYLLLRVLICQRAGYTSEEFEVG
ncbi:ceramidase domain-containing protein [Roseibium sediminis]|uniref:ceramidase domain-containing protein n=1 Tax=Roseibium sediminis TaxID=1775174 RepID=UPI00123D3E90|nr:ceramidase domain-containing protein [Roseibium sediminis]